MEQGFMAGEDRYKALGIPYPDLETMCVGDCEGTGIYPQNIQDPTISTVELELWEVAHNRPNAHEDEPCDGWHFIKCFTCNGTGKRLN